MLTIESLTNSKIVISLLANNSNHTLRGSTSRYNNITLFSEASPNFDNDDNDA